MDYLVVLVALLLASLLDPVRLILVAAPTAWLFKYTEKRGMVWLGMAAIAIVVSLAMFAILPFSSLPIGIVASLIWGAITIGVLHARQKRKARAAR